VAGQTTGEPCRRYKIGTSGRLETNRIQRFLRRNSLKYPTDKQLQSDGNMPALQEKESSRFRRGDMSIDFWQAAASRMAAVVVARYNGERVEGDSVHPMPPALLNVHAQCRQNQAGGHA
jgi:hypothetical protein